MSQDAGLVSEHIARIRQANAQQVDGLASITSSLGAANGGPAAGPS
jgi:hypothetical protein